MAKMYSGTAQRAAPSANTTVAPSPGKLWGIVASSSNAAAADTIIFYDKTSAAAPILLQLHVSALSGPFAVNFPDYRPLKFATGLTITCPATAECTVIVEY